MRGVLLTGVVLFVGCGKAARDEGPDPHSPAQGGILPAKSGPPKADLAASVPSASFSGIDPNETLRWLQSEHSKIRKHDQKGNEFANKTRAELLGELTKSMVGKEVAWPIPVSRINKGGMVRTQAVTLTDEPARSRYAIYPRSPKQENIAEQMLAPTEPRDWLRTVVAGDLVKARGIIRKVELKPDVQDWVFKDGRHGTITEYQWWVELSPGHVEPAK